MVSAFKGYGPKAKTRKKIPSKLESTTLRGFGGGWNAIDEDLSMPPKFQVELINFHRTSSGSQAVRFGSTFYADIKSVNDSPIVDGTYFNDRTVVVCQNGRVLTIDSTGTVITIIWSPAIVTALPPPNPNIPWSTGLTFVSFVPFKDSLIIHNGVDKPIIINSKFETTWLQDPSNGSTVNVPIGRYGCVASNYHCIAGLKPYGTPPVPHPTEVFVSAKGTAGVWPKDENSDGMSFDVGAFAPEGAASIRGIAGFRTYLLVFLQNVTVQVKLGEYDATGHHQPKFPDTLPQFGLLGSRSIVTVENDMMFCGLSGLASAKRNLYSPDTVMSDFLSSLISPAYRREVGALTDNEQLNVAFAVYDKLNNDFLLSLVNGRMLCYTFNPRLKMHAWSAFESMGWTAGWTSILGRMYLAKGTRIFQSGNDTFTGEDYHADRILDRDYSYAASRPSFAVNDLVYDTVTGEVWKCLIAHAGAPLATFDLERAANPTAWAQYFGNSIPFEMELPWIDGKDPTKLKQLRFVSVASKGDAEFSVDAYVDNLFKDVQGNVVYNPSASMVFIGNDAYGYGFDDGSYGMGRRSRDPRLYGFPLKFKVIKFRITGSINKKLDVVNMSFLFARGQFTI